MMIPIEFPELEPEIHIECNVEINAQFNAERFINIKNKIKADIPLSYEEFLEFIQQFYGEALAKDFQDYED